MTSSAVPLIILSAGLIGLVGGRFWKSNSTSSAVTARLATLPCSTTKRNHLRTAGRRCTALSAITAAVVGVVLNLAVSFALNALFPSHHQLDWFALGLTVVVLVGMLRLKWDVIPVVVGSGMLGFLYRVVLH